MFARASFIVTASTIGLALLSHSAAAQTILYDSRAMATGGTWNNIADSIIGGFATSGSGSFDHDSQVADDFTLAGRTRLTQITLDTVETTSGSGMPSGGFLVEVFPNIAGNHPAETPVVSVLVAPAQITLVGLFPNSTTNPSMTTLPGDRTTWSIDLTTSNVVLEPGTWWLSATPKNDGDPFGSSFRHIGLKTATGVPDLGVAAAHRRCGGLDHGNNYPCWNSSSNLVPDWTSNAGGVTSRAANLSVRIEGLVIQGACCTGTTCSVVAGAVACPAGSNYQGDQSACGPAGNPTTCCPANYDGVNGLTIQDIFDFLAAWFAGMPASDFNHAGGATVQDIFDFLAAWFAGC